MAKDQAKLRVEPLEGREVPAPFGLPWGNAGHLTLSFAPDDTPVAGESNALESEFEKFPGDDAWKRDILRAFQTWAVRANINVALTEETLTAAGHGWAFGSAGAMQNDARFGDIRIAAAPMSGESVAVSAPHDPFLSGTWAGDVVFNTKKDFFDTTQAPAPGQASLFAVALHEAGHVLGLGHNASPASVMYSHLGNTRRALSPADVTNLRALYGTRAADPYERGLYGNNFLRTATLLNAVAEDGEFDGDLPLAVFGDLRSTADVDHFAFVVPDRYTGPVTFRLQTAGVSLLNPKLTVRDAAGQVVEEVSSTNLGGDTLTVTVAGTPGQRYTLRVDGATNDVFGAGGYALAVILPDRLNPVVTEERITGVLTGPYRSLTQDDINYLFEDPAYLVNEDGGENETAGTATRLALPRGYRTPTHFEYMASLAGPTDVDTYAVRTPAWVGPGVLTATVWSMNPSAPPPAVQVTDRLGNVLPAAILANGNGTYTVQLTRAAASRDYFVRLTGAQAGNYSLTIDLTRRAANVKAFASDTLTARPNDARALYVAQSQVLDFILTAKGTAGGVRMTVFEAVNRDGVNELSALYVLEAPAGQTRTGPGLFLKGGTYAIVFESVGGAAGYDLRGAGLTVPIGPVTTDPSTDKPIFTLPGAPPGQYVYPGDLIGAAPALGHLIGDRFGIPVQPPAPTKPVPSKDPFRISKVFEF